ncbi:hypothetical protein DV735_g3265, partial [Chaetothyriales sp. CBS 134920]
MDSRFKTWFWSSRRVRPEPTSVIYDLTLRGVSYDSVAPSATPPVFSHPIPPRHPRRPTVNASTLAYDDTTAGNAPIFGGRPIKGNGPAKLPAHHSGEWTPVSPDADSTWEVVEPGDYAASKVSSRFSQTTPTLPLRSASPKRWSAFPSSKPPVSAALPMRSSSVSPLLGIPEHTASMDDLGSPSAGRSGSLVSSDSPPMLPCKHASIQSKHSIPGLGGNEVPPAPIGILKNSSKISLLEPRDEHNPTMRALWKAESSRLHSICGQGTFDHYLYEPRRGSVKPSMDSPILEPVPMARNECRDTSISFTLSRADTCHLDDVSDISSSGRLSHSSTAISSHTSSASTIESDSFTSRADIHKMVEEMRATYLQALEARENPLYSGSKSAKKSKKKRKSSTPSTRTTRSESKSDMGSISADHRSGRSGKMVFQPLDDIANLPDVDGSHRQGRIFDLDLDAGFLPGHRPESNRSTKVDKAQRDSRQRSKHFNNLSPRNATLAAAAEPEEIDPDKEFAEIYRLSLNDLWRSSPNLASTTSPRTNHTCTNHTSANYTPTFI